MDVPWAGASPPYGASTGEMDIVRVFVNTAGLNAGSSHGTLCVVNHEATRELGRGCARPLPSSANVPVVAAAQARRRGGVPAGQQRRARVKVWNACPGEPMPYRLTASAPSVPCGGHTGEHNAVKVRFGTAGMPSGLYTGVVLVASSAATNPPVALEVVLTVRPETAVLACLPYLLADRVPAGAGEGGVYGVEVWNASQTPPPDDLHRLDGRGGPVAPPDTVSRGREQCPHSVTFTNLSALVPGTYTGSLGSYSPSPGIPRRTCAACWRWPRTPPSLELSCEAMTATNLQGQCATPTRSRHGQQSPCSAGRPSTAAWLAVEPATGASTGGTWRFLPVPLVWAAGGG